MSETPNPASEPGNTNPSPGGGDPKKVTVTKSAEELTQSLIEASAEAKKYRQGLVQAKEEADRIRKENEELKASKLKEQGEFKSLYEQEKAEREKLAESVKRDKAAFAYKAVTSEFAAQAAGAGCRNTGDLIKLATADGLISELEVSSEDYSVTPDSLKTVLAKAQQKYSYLYGQPTPGINDGLPNGNPKQTAQAQANLSNMSIDDLVKLAHKL